MYNVERFGSLGTGRLLLFIQISLEMACFRKVFSTILQETHWHTIQVLIKKRIKLIRLLFNKTTELVTKEICSFFLLVYSMNKTRELVTEQLLGLNQKHFLKRWWFVDTCKKKMAFAALTTVWLDEKAVAPSSLTLLSPQNKGTADWMRGLTRACWVNWSFESSSWNEMAFSACTLTPLSLQGNRRLNERTSFLVFD